MATSLPISPSIDDEIIVGGKLLVWNGSLWARASKYAIIDGGHAGTNVVTEVQTADGGDA
jgi:hypothetical protein